MNSNSEIEFEFEFKFGIRIRIRIPNSNSNSNSGFEFEFEFKFLGRRGFEFEFEFKSLGRQPICSSREGSSTTVSHSGAPGRKVRRQFRTLELPGGKSERSQSWGQSWYNRWTIVVGLSRRRNEAFGRKIKIFVSKGLLAGRARAVLTHFYLL